MVDWTRTYANYDWHINGFLCPWCGVAIKRDEREMFLSNQEVVIPLSCDCGWNGEAQFMMTDGIITGKHK